MTTCNVTEKGAIWDVPLGQNTQGLTLLKFERGRTSPAYTVILVNTKVFSQLYENNYDSIKPISRAATWPSQNIIGLASFLAATPREMPRVGFDVNFRRRFRWFGKIKKMPVLNFGNGRHRFRYLEYAGAQCFPVEVHTRSASLLHEWCGA
ncbi:plasmid fertility inhibition factor family protein [Xanthomonas arboricola]|uniref:plasmid fertility inhibition factor family protein n=1 Tax=Xanthomonas arboricola TaxID=56448 RepID=UPI003CCF2BE6